MAQIPTNLEEVKPVPAFYPTQFLPAYSAAPYYTSQVAAAPVTTVAAAPVASAPVTSSQYLGTVPVASAVQQPIKGESRIEYIPYEKGVIEYEAVPRTEYVAREKKVVDYYAVEYQTEYVPQVFQDKYVEYIPQERVVERVEYTPVERQIVHQPQQEVVQQEVAVQQVAVQQPVQYVQQPVQYVQQPVQYVQQPVQYVQQPVQYVQQPVQYLTQSVQVARPTVQVSQPAAVQVSQPAALQYVSQYRPAVSSVLPAQFARTGLPAGQVVDTAKNAANNAQRKVQQRRTNESNERNWLENLFDFSNP